MFDLTGKVALVTGGSRGIGRAIALQMANAGAKVVVSSRKIDACQLTVDAIRANGGEAHAVACNVSHHQELQLLVQETQAVFGSIDVLVCNAAVNPYYGPFLDTPDEAFHKTIAANVHANMKLSKLVSESMVEKRDGVIIMISSIAALKGCDLLGMYAVTKAADIQIIKNLAVALGPHNVRVNGIAPGLVKTDMARALWEDPARAAKVINSYPLRRLGEPDDIAGAAVFLASRAGGWMSGQTLVIDGGWSASGEV